MNSINCLRTRSFALLIFVYIKSSIVPHTKQAFSECLLCDTITLRLFCEGSFWKDKKQKVEKEAVHGVPVVAQWLTNPTRNHEVEGSIPALAQWVKVPALP